MEASPDAVNRLEELEDSARWAWHGPTGEFALLQLYRKHEASGVIYEPWSERGPIFGSPFDHDKYIPLWLANFDPVDVFGLGFIPIVRQWMIPIKKRMLDSATERGLRYDSSIRGLAGEMGDKMYRDAQRSLHSPIKMARRFLTDDDKAVLSGESMRDVTQDFMPN